jgi:hypothetical protein
VSTTVSLKLYSGAYVSSSLNHSKITPKARTPIPSRSTIVPIGRSALLMMMMMMILNVVRSVIIVRLRDVIRTRFVVVRGWFRLEIVCVVWFVPVVGLGPVVRRLGPVVDRLGPFVRRFGPVAVVIGLVVYDCGFVVNGQWFLYDRIEIVVFVWETTDNLDEVACRTIKESLQCNLN